MKTYEVTMERSAYRVVTLAIKAESEEAAEALALAKMERLGTVSDEVVHDETYEDTESSWTVNEVLEAE